MAIAEQLLAEGKVQGVVQGELRRVVASVLTVLEARDLSVTAEVRARVESCPDVEVLQDWLTRAATAASVDDVFEG